MLYSGKRPASLRLPRSSLYTFRCLVLWVFDHRPRSALSWTASEALFLSALGCFVRVFRETCAVLSSGLSTTSEALARLTDDQRLRLGQASVRFVGIGCLGRFGAVPCSLLFSRQGYCERCPLLLEVLALAVAMLSR